MRPARRRRPPLGQNFLVDRAASERIAEALAPTPGAPVLEIGPGRGALTGPLIARAGRVCGVEIDSRLADALRLRFTEDRLLIVRDDILRIDLASAGPWLGWPAGTPLLVAGNLPYGISKPVALMLAQQRVSVGRAVLMFQKEVAERLTASPGERAYAPLTVLVTLCYEVECLFDLSPAAFRPRPAVRSTVTLWKPRVPALLEASLEPSLMACLGASFRHRRRTLHNNLRAHFGSASESARALEAAGLDGTLRAERVPPAGFLALAAVWGRAL